MRHFDLCIIGSGSGNTIVDEQFADQQVALVDQGVGPDHVFGGTCLNLGCIPTKMFVLPADLAGSPAEAARLGVDLEFVRADWPAIRDRIFGRIDPISAGGEEYRAGADNVTLYREHARFVGERRLQVGDETITADRFVIAAGSRAIIPDIPGISDVTVHTSDTVMRIDKLPASMIIIGGGFISAEFAHVFAAFGVDVTVLLRSDRMLRGEDEDVSARFTELMAEKVTIRKDTTITGVRRTAGGVQLQTDGGDDLEADLLLVATGRQPNGDLLDVAAAGVDLDDQGRVVVDDYQRTAAEGVFALGDVSSPYQLKHVANLEARVVQHNLLHPDAMITADHRFVPHAVFSDPQVASVGLTEAEAIEQGVDYTAAIQDYGSVAYGWALEDTRHFAKLIADRQTRRLIGAHIIGPQASSLIQPLIQAMSFGLTAPEMARGQYWIHPALPELVENALLALKFAD
ncbi:mycothione reductase [Microlunatus soli]|uniref:Mycothione reductase n=1 Tax=Microlunatus soli TaxID=630515 RepID=A0A1H1S8N2_9ACTN|nr:mycothione reductase [Microlunatus soli]SDS44335.1 mycothione reductase [Microlunatus soli]